MKLERDLREIRRMATDKEEENWRFRSFLKRYDGPARKVDSLVHHLYRNVSSEIECRECANCCRVILPILSEEDIRNLSEGLGLFVDEFRKEVRRPRGDRRSIRFQQTTLPDPNLMSILLMRRETPT